MEKIVEQIRQTRGEMVNDGKDADAFAWAALEPKSKLTQIGIKHPALGKGDVRVKITYTGVCQSDVSIIDYKYGDHIPTCWPSVCGHEIVGRIIKTGESVKGYKEGDLVGIGPIRECCGQCNCCKRGQENLCTGVAVKLTAGSYFGGFATEIQLPQSFLFKVPDGMDEKLCPSLFCAGGTVYNPLKKFGKPGCSVAVIGVGGLGHLALMMANKKGYTVYAVSTSDSKKQMALDFGAHHFIVSKNEEDLKKFHAAEIDLIINTTSSPDVMPYIRGLKKGTGVYVHLAGTDTNTLNLSVAEIILGQYTVAGSAAYSIDDMVDMLNFCKTHSIYPKCEYFTWDNFNEAVEKCRSGKVEFRSVVDVNTFKK